MPERRFVAANAKLNIWQRASEDGEKSPVMRGHASVFDEWTTLYEGRRWTVREIIRPGAFKRAIKEGQDVRALFNHDPNFVLGRTISGTLKLREDERGLMSETDLPKTRTVEDLVIEPILRGDISGMSFAFLPRNGGKAVTTENEDGSIITDLGGERWTDYERDGMEYSDREIVDADLFDISAVTYPQYEGTDLALRSAGLDVTELEAAAAQRRAVRQKRAKEALGLRLALSRLSLINTR